MPGFHKGSSGSPFHTEYYGNQGIEMGPGGAPSEEMPRVGPGVLNRKVTTEMTRAKRGNSNATGTSKGDDD